MKCTYGIEFEVEPRTAILAHVCKKTCQTVCAHREVEENRHNFVALMVSPTCVFRKKS